MPKPSRSSPPKDARNASTTEFRWSAQRILLIIVVGVILGVAGSLAMKPPRGGATQATSPPAAKPLVSELNYAQLTALADTVKRLQAERRYGEALPGARRLLDQHELRGHLGASMLVDYGRMQNNAAFEGGPGAPRSSFERIALEQRAMVTAQVALAMATTPRERAEAVTFVGLVHEAWGFPYDAYQSYRAALTVDPTYPVAIQHFKAFGRQLVTVRVPR